MDQYIITDNHLINIISRAISLGQVQARQAMMPQADRVNKKQVVNYLRTQGYSEADLKHWEVLGLVKGQSKGERSATKYSMRDILQAVLSAEVESAFK